MHIFKNPKKLLFLMVLAAIWLFSAAGAMAQIRADSKIYASPQGQAATEWAQNDHGSVRLIASSLTAGSGLSLSAGLHFKPVPGWHIYWRSPGDAGYPPRIDWTGSENLAGADFHWPAPVRFSQSGIETAGYNAEVVLPITLRWSKQGQGAKLAAKVDYLTCADICIPYQYNFQMELPPGANLNSPEKDWIEVFSDLVPTKTNQGDLIITSINISGSEDSPALQVQAASAFAFDKPDIFVESALPIAFGGPKTSLSQGGLQANFTVPIIIQNKEDFQKLLNAPVTVTVTSHKASKSAEWAAIPARMTESAPYGYLVIVLIALLGGFILNFMPCVLPVLSLKIIKLVNAQDQDKAHIRRSFVAGAMGIVASFWALAAIAVAVKISGGQVGWGVQFQSPAFLIVMTAIMLVFAANMWGLFEFRMPGFVSGLDAALGLDKGRNSFGRDFLLGCLATVMATPCSAPFVGTALGFALSQGAAQIFLIFTFLGLGLALPYLLIALRPGIAHRFPRPGKWMNGLRRILALLLLLTALWLGAIAATHFMSAASGSASKSALPWQEFSADKIGAALAQDKTVFVDITADWCLTCKVNDRLVLSDLEIQSLLRAPNVILLRGDWTRPDPMISTYLASHGRYGIPFNAVYSKANPQGKPLPELLTKSAVKEALSGSEK